ncbi:hypothetical protein KEM48_013057 [Puccinia striiformis f. sp. tritici PST-130]|nr:hypothetical protein KEM48_013057 [Puccinia striiformis f. sp. tritici PST-130]
MGMYSKEQIRTAIYKHVRQTLQRRHREANSQDPEKKKASAKDTRHYQRFGNLRHERAAMVNSMPGFNGLDNVVRACCSDDDTDPESDQRIKKSYTKKQPKLFIVRPVPWRHPRIKRLMIALDKLIVRRREATPKGPSVLLLGYAPGRILYLTVNSNLDPSCPKAALTMNGVIPDLPHEYSVIPEEPKEADKILSGPLPSDQVCAKDESPHAPEAEQPLKIRICRPLNNNMKPGPLVPSAPTTHSHPPDVEVAPEEADTSKSDLPEPEGATVELHKSQGAPWSQVAQKFAKDPRSAFAKKNMPTSKHSSRQCTGRVLYKGQTTCVKEGAGTNKGSNVGTKKGRNVGTNEGTSAKEASDVGTNKATSANEASEVGIKEGNHFGAQGAVSTTTISFQPAPLTDADWERMAARGAAYWEAHWDNKHTKDLILPKPSQDVVANTQSLPNEHVANAAGYRCSARRTGTSVP